MLSSTTSQVCGQHSRRHEDASVGNMPLEISPASELFQQRLDQNLEGLPVVRRIFDDLLITGKGAILSAASPDHDKKLWSLLKRFHKVHNGLPFRTEDEK